MIDKPIPDYILKYFWGDNLNELDLQKNKIYIVQTLLEKGDQKAINWLFSNLDSIEVKKTLSSLRLSKKSEHFWNFYLS
jgi:hypothetical protein